MPTLRVGTFNIRHGLGLDGRLDLARTGAVLTALDCDVLAVQEVDVGCRRSGRVDQAAELGRRTGLQAYFGPAIPYQGGQYGILILSRLPLTRWSASPLPGREPRCVLTAELAWSGRSVRLCATHLDLDADQRALALPRLRGLLESDGLPFVLAGDLNATPDSGLVQTLVAAWGAEAALAGPATYPADAPQERIDHLLPGPAGAWRILSVAVVPEALASDHRPVVAVLEPGAAAAETKPQRP